MTVLKQTFGEAQEDRQPAREGAAADRASYRPDGAARQADRFDVTRLSAREIAAELARNSRSDRPAPAVADPAATSWQSLSQPAAQTNPANFSPASLSPAERQRAKSAYAEERYRREDEEQARLRAEELRQGLRQSLRQGYRDPGHRDPTPARAAPKAAPQKPVTPQMSAQQSGPYYSDAPQADHAAHHNVSDVSQPHYEPAVNRFAAQRGFVAPDPAVAPQPDIDEAGRREPHFAYGDPTGPQPDYPHIDTHSEAAEEVFDGDPAQAQPVPSLLPRDAMPTDAEQPHILSAFDLPGVERADQPEVLLLDDTALKRSGPPLYRQPQPVTEPAPDIGQPEEDSPYPAPFPKLLNEVRTLQEARQPKPDPDLPATALYADASRDRYSIDQDAPARRGHSHAADLRIPEALRRRDEMVTDLAVPRYTGWRNALAATTLLAVLALGPALYYGAHLGSWGQAQSELRTSLDYVMAKTGLATSDPAAAASGDDKIATATPAPPQTTTATTATTTAAPVTAQHHQPPAVAMEPVSASAVPAPVAPVATTAATAAIPVAPPKMAHKVAPDDAPPAALASSKPAPAGTTPVSSGVASTTTTGESGNKRPDDAIADLITAAGGGTTHLVASPGAAQPPLQQPVLQQPATTRKAAAATGSAWMKAQPYDPDKTAPRAAEVSDAPVRDAGGDGEAVIYDGTPDAWLKRQPYNPGVLTVPAN